MKLSIVIPDEMKQRLDSYIAKRFGNQKPRAFSLVIREAVNDFLSRQQKLEELEKQQK
ncbi:unnamed protein product [marine sediment metagenome]|uniref:Uncharacterized protein n=1 Tax=marine sediment metagenome TaxID=412755 RepID=X1RE68_9ZZZZ